jgi:hypothetical protein
MTTQAERLCVAALGNSEWDKKSAAQAMAIKSGTRLQFPPGERGEPGGRNQAALAQFEALRDGMIAVGILEDTGNGKIKVASAERRAEIGKDAPPDGVDYRPGVHTPAPQSPERPFTGTGVEVRDEYGTWHTMAYNTPETNAERQRIHQVLVARHLEDVSRQLGVDISTFVR